MPINITCERCGRLMGSVSLKAVRDWDEGETCGVCLKRDEELLKFYENKKAAYFNKMNLLVNDFKLELADEIRRISQEETVL